MSEARSSKLESRLRDLQRLVPEIEAAALVSVDGLMIASSLPRNVSEDRVAAMSAALISVAERMGKELERGDFQMGVINGDKGYVILTNAGPEAVLVALATKEAKLGLVFLEMRRAAKDLKEIL